MTVLEQYHRLIPVTLPTGVLVLKEGVRGFPELPPGAAVFRGRLRIGSPDEAGRVVVDATGTAGAVALEAMAADPGAVVSVLEPSHAALRCARESLRSKGVSVEPGLPWEVTPGSVSSLALAPPADRGNARVAAELEAARSALRPDGTLYLALHKDQGAKRYGAMLSRLFGSVEIAARDRGWRLLVATGPGMESEGSDGRDPVVLPGLAWELDGLEMKALPGVHSAGRVDPGTAVLASEVPWERLAGREVLDLGCGSGVLALLAARAGGRVTASDDDWAAIESTRWNAERNRLRVDVCHSDIDSELGARRFDVILTNPPFHVGRGVRLAVPEAFIAAARGLLRPNGELWLVANRDLPYERMLRGWSSSLEVTNRNGFKVIKAVA